MSSNKNQSRPDTSQLKLLYQEARNPPKDPTASFKGKAVLVTGSNTGIGYQAALKFAALGASPLILGVRTQEKGDATKASIIRETGNDNILVIPVDLSTFASVTQFVDRIKSEVPRLDVALLNAGLAMPTFTTSPEGYEIALQVNILSTALMGLLLLPKLRESASQGSDFVPHLTFTSSKGYQDVDETWLKRNSTLIDQLNDGTDYSDKVHYMLAKLAVMFVIRGVAERNGDGTVIVNGACPGFCKTDLGRNFSAISKVVMAPIQYFVARTAEQGSRSLVSATVAGPESTAKLWSDDKILPYVLTLISPDKC
jgi:NAD(P)-dependent dehydrogenase (short-subunit alcohol dehydrogenase family)